MMPTSHSIILTIALAVAAAAAIALAGCKPQAPTGCGSDRDCKGDRICQNRACIDPPAKAAPAVRVPGTDEATSDTRQRPNYAKEAFVARGRVAFYAAKLAAWFADHDQGCPTSLDEIVAAATVHTSHTDPWGRAYVLKCGPTAPDDARGGILSLGPDGQEGTDDDLRSWVSSSKP